ncbi:MAG TPA: ATP-binding protein [Vicinamibacterales bacterium]|nr:ATP-binding protein [Vicinamibacterales bacterium]
MSIKQKQVLGVTSIVILVVVVLSGLQFAALTRTLLQQSRQRGELIAETVFHRAQEVVTSAETGYQDLRRDPAIRTALESSLYSEDVVYAAIVDRSGAIVAHSDPSRMGERLPDGDDLAALANASGLTQLRAVYQTARMLEWRQPMLLGDMPFAEVRVGLSTFLIRDTLTDALQPAALAAVLALAVAIVVAIVLAQVVVRPIHVIRSGLSRLGQGDLGATLDLQGDEFKELGDVFASVTNQLKAVMPDNAKRAQLLELSRRVTALGRLTAGVAHEVKNPLNAMTIHLELLKQKLAAGADATATNSHVDIIAREIRRLDDVVQGFLKFARPEELELQPVAAAALVDEVLKALAVEANVTGVTLEAAVAGNVPDIEADPGILRQALLNLAKNAVQAMPDGGKLVIACAPTRDGRVEIRVTDTGVGIAPENLAKIFDLYFTTKETGTGIGLSLVYRTVQLHHGDIDVASTPGVGTTFVIKMPKAGAQTPQKPPTSSLRAESLRLQRSQV